MSIVPVKKNAEKYRKKIEKKFSQRIKSENLAKELEEEILIYLFRKL
ncbi:hypothetical protein [Flavobacterium sp. N1736]|nr:hypothetical protein [Flavobacterium sp. N1736]